MGGNGVSGGKPCQNIFFSLNTAQKGPSFLKEKAAPREAEIRKTFTNMGGKVEEFYWTTGGEHSGAIVLELPDAATPAAFTMVAESTGAFDAVAWTEVLTSSELDRVLAKTMAYRPPGG
jgi:uncharacterized protein with GYD domain